MTGWEKKRKQEFEGDEERDKFRDVILEKGMHERRGQAHFLGVLGFWVGTRVEDRGGCVLGWRASQRAEDFDGQDKVDRMEGA